MKHTNVVSELFRVNVFKQSNLFDSFSDILIHICNFLIIKRFTFSIKTIFIPIKLFDYWPALDIGCLGLPKREKSRDTESQKEKGAGAHTLDSFLKLIGIYRLCRWWAPALKSHDGKITIQPCLLPTSTHS